MHRADSVLAAGRQVFAYLSEVDSPPRAPCDAIIGFGVFDLALPRFCGDIYRQGGGARILFTGGIGAGTGSLGAPEATAWRAELRRSHPDISDDVILLENASSNTGENIAFTARMLEQSRAGWRFGHGIRTAIVVASPSRLRRVWLAMRRQQPSVRVFRQVPPPDFDRERALYAQHGVDYLPHLAGELDRILDYGTRGWIQPEPLPDGIAAAHDILKTARR